MAKPAAREHIGGKDRLSHWTGADSGGFYWQGAQILAEDGAPHAKVYVAGLGGVPQVATTIHHTQYYHHGWAGRLAATTNGAGDVTGSYRYTAYGVPTYFGVADEVGNVSEPERLLFNGQPWFGQLGLYRLVNRWYSPHQASFITPDPLGLIDDPNRYSYGRNHPLMWIDPLGLAAEGPFAGFKRAALMVGGYAWQATRTAAHDPLMAPMFFGVGGWLAPHALPTPDDSLISGASLGDLVLGKLGAREL